MYVGFSSSLMSVWYVKSEGPYLMSPPPEVSAPACVGSGVQVWGGGVAELGTQPHASYSARPQLSSRVVRTWGYMAVQCMVWIILTTACRD